MDEDFAIDSDAQHQRAIDERKVRAKTLAEPIAKRLNLRYNQFEELTLFIDLFLLSQVPNFRDDVLGRLLENVGNLFVASQDS